MTKNIDLELIDSSISRAIDYIFKLQEPDGSFPSYTSAKIDKFNDAVLCKSNFATSLISLCLSDINSNKTRAITKKISDYLLNEKGQYWTFNYWSRESKSYKTMPYPDDLDDTSCALAAIFKQDSNIIDGDVLAKISIVLTNLEYAIGGPYKTWLVPPQAKEGWHDVDPAVNANIAYFLSLIDVRLPKINKYLIDKLDSGLTSPYYPTVYPIFYFISRFYRGKQKKKIIEKLFEFRKTKMITNPLDVALFLTTCVNLNHKYPEMIADAEFILSKQANNGSWPTHAFYAGINPTKVKGEYFEGAESLTSAFCVEALHKYINCYKKIDIKLSQASIQSEEQKIKKEIINKFNTEFENFSDDLKSTAAKLLKKIATCNVGDQALLLPLFFKESIVKEKSTKINNKLILSLGLGNLLGWIAYTIYDDFFDNEGDPLLLSVANICLRKLTGLYNNELNISDFSPEVFEPFMDRLDKSNFWEVANCNLNISGSKIDSRSVNFGNNSILIAEKSIGHILGPLNILYSLNLKKDSADFQNTEKFLTHYLVAKQLNDDAHDWEEDLRLGKTTAVLSILFNDLGDKEIDLDKIIKLKEVFWTKTILKVCDLVEFHLNNSMKYLQQVSILDNPTIFENLIHELEEIVKQTKKERRDTLDFINNYS